MVFRHAAAEGYVIKAEHITATWNVSKYDITTMAETGLIRFVGTRRTGSYEIDSFLLNGGTPRICQHEPRIQIP